MIDTRYCVTARISPKYLLDKHQDFLSKADFQWLSIWEEIDGIVYYGDFPQIIQQLSACVALFLRNSYDARLLPVDVLRSCFFSNEYTSQHGFVIATVICIPNISIHHLTHSLFYDKFTSYLLMRLSQNKPTILHFNDMLSQQIILEKFPFLETFGFVRGTHE